MVYAEFGGQTECIMGNSKIENIAIRAVSRAASKSLPMPEMTFNDLSS